MGQYDPGINLERIYMDILRPSLEIHMVIIDQYTKWNDCFPLQIKRLNFLRSSLLTISYVDWIAHKNYTLTKENI